MALIIFWDPEWDQINLFIRLPYIEICIHIIIISGSHALCMGYEIMRVAHQMTAKNHVRMTALVPFDCTLYSPTGCAMWGLLGEVMPFINKGPNSK